VGDGIVASIFQNFEVLFHSDFALLFSFLKKGKTT
jgi:hypothetical protein